MCVTNALWPVLERDGAANQSERRRAFEQADRGHVPEQFRRSRWPAAEQAARPLEQVECESPLPVPRRLEVSIDEFEGERSRR